MRLIDADALRDLIDGGFDIDFDETPEVKAELLKMIDYQETIDAAPIRRGKWVDVTNGRGGHECNQCHGYAPAWQTGEEHLTDFCPNCGARMEEEWREYLQYFAP